MELNQLRVFQAAARYGGFTRASEQLHLSQSTVSQHIQQLEREVGCALFLRVGKRVLLSEAGELLLQYAERIFRDVENAEMALRELNSLQRGTVRLGVGATTLTYRLPKVLGEYKRRFPEIDLVVETGTTEFLLQAVRTHSLDLAIVMSPEPMAALNLRLLGKEELVVVLNRHHPLARRQVLEPQDLQKLRFIFYPSRTAMQNLIDSYFEGLEIRPAVAMEIESIEAIKSVARAGLGASIVPLCAVAERTQSAHLKVLRVKGRPLFRQLGLVTLDAGMQPAAMRELGARLARVLGG
ncbi:MAG TPA: LysR substrate-binding domain-containing protein [Candidatus Sulfopaludibacter sp.]|nr:LysR substrate-binding domain-containing protein [Candidatus Sulfopaludibacter sp.]